MSFSILGVEQRFNCDIVYLDLSCIILLPVEASNIEYVLLGRGNASLLSFVFINTEVSL